ncbi:MAG TPA: ATP-binding protein, partial [Vicinamibacteria bacterium]|nr:ATP-binding protein [Vicinamibacteria bacterium]
FLAVHDDGCGLPPRVLPGLGLRGMRERAAALGGGLDFSSNPGRGTTVTAHVPLKVDPCPRFAS